MRSGSNGTKNDAVEGNWLVNSRMIHSIASRAPLHTFDMSNCFALSHAAFSCLPYLRHHLQKLSLAYTAFDDSDCPNLSVLTSLRSLNLLGCCVGDEGLSYIAPLAELRHLQLGGPWYHDNGVPRLPSSVITTAGWIIVGSLLKLESLIIKCIPMSADSHNALSALVNLKILSIGLADVDSPDLTPLMTEGSTTPLEAPQDLQFISGMVELEHLRLDTLTHLTREGAIQLCGRSSGSFGSNSSTQSLQNLGKKRYRTLRRQRLLSLDLPLCSLSSLVFPFIQSLRNLRRISCLHCSFTRAQIVDSFPNLEHLDCVDGFGPASDDTDPIDSNEPFDLNFLLSSDDHDEETQSLGASTEILLDPLDTLSSHLSSLDIPFDYLYENSRASSPSSHLEVDDDLSPLFQISTLTDLEVDFTNASDLLTSIEASSSSLRRLTLFDDEGEDFSDDLEEFPLLPQLTVLSAHSASVSNSWSFTILQLFISSPHLTRVCLSLGKGERLPSSFDPALGSLQLLEILELRNFRGIKSLACIPTLSRLHSLKIEGTEKPSSGFTTLFNDIAQSSSIRRLAITYSADVYDADLRPIVKRMHDLVELDLTSLERITDRTLKRLSKPGSGLHHLSIVRVKYCPLLTPSGLICLSKLRGLYRIDTSVQSRYHYSQDQSEIDNLFSVFSRNFISAN